MKDLAEWQSRIRIDRNNLDGELVEQPQLFWEVSEAFVHAVSQRDQAKDNLERTRAERSLAIRQEAVDGGEKLTESAIQAHLETDTEFRGAAKAFLVVKEEADLLQALKETFSQRAYILKDLAGLYVAGYYATGAVRAGPAADARGKAYEDRKARIDEKRKGKG